MIWTLLLGVMTECPITECESQSSHICATFNNEKITLKRCLGDDWCDIKKLYPAYNSEEEGLACEKIQKENKINNIQEIMISICEKKEKIDIKDRLLEGKHPKICNRDNDCLMENGNKGKCECGLNKDRKAFCSIGEFDDLSQELIESACIGKVDEFLYRLYYKELFPFVQDRIECSDFVFEDISILTYLSMGNSVGKEIFPSL